MQYYHNSSLIQFALSDSSVYILIFRRIVSNNTIIMIKLTKTLQVSGNKMLFFLDAFFLAFVISLRFCVRRQSANFADWKLEITIGFLKDFLMKTPPSSYCYNWVASRLCGSCGACSLSKLQCTVHAKICGRPWRRDAFVYPLVHLHVTCEWHS